MADINQAGTEVRVNMGEARGRLTDLVELVQTGSRVFLMKRGVPVVEMIVAKDYSRARHSHQDDVSCQAAGDAGHPPRNSHYDIPHRCPEDCPPAFAPPPPPPPEERPRVAPKPPRDRAVSLQTTQAAQAARDRILGNLGGKKKSRGG